MSITASVFVRPSATLRVLRACYGCAVVLSGLVYPDWGLLCLMLALAARADLPGAPRRIDISAGGQWRLTVYQVSTPRAMPVAVPSPAGQAFRMPAWQAGHGPLQASAQCVAPACVTRRMTGLEAVHYLQAGTLLWPGLMCLQLRAQDGSTLRLLVLPDSVSGPGWRSLMLASRAFAARSEIKLRAL